MKAFAVLTAEHKLQNLGAATSQGMLLETGSVICVCLTTHLPPLHKQTSMQHTGSSASGMLVQGPGVTCHNFHQWSRR